jgi:serine/threonine-protein kinase
MMRAMSSERWLAEGALVASRYRCTGLLARGGMGVVYAALDEKLGREVALKVLHLKLAEDATVVGRFHREALAAARLQHPGIVQVLDFGTDPRGFGYLVMERVRGETLSALLGREGHLDPLRAADLVEQILGALAAAHAAGIVHRDLKPGNVMVVQTGASREITKLLDFGIAQVMATELYTRLTRTGMVVGTPTYMAPEQAMGGTTDARTDVYAVGVLLWCLLTGHKPFHAGELAVVVEQVLRTVPPRADQVRPSVPRELASVAEIAMQKDPSRRFQGAEAMAQALVAARAHLGRERSRVPPAPTPERVSMPALDTSQPATPRSASEARRPVLEAPRPARDRVATALRGRRLSFALAALALLGLVGACGVGAGLASGMPLLGRHPPAPAGPVPRVSNPSTPHPVGGAPLAGALNSAAAECARTASCCEVFARAYGVDLITCESMRTYPHLYGVTRCVDIRGRYRAALLASHRDPTPACDP